jgi:hypothetical protein
VGRFALTTAGLALFLSATTVPAAHRAAPVRLG